jgi:NAD(P)-dependent dehydrogenase (short-subunit alcohol dehydrogenase family)
LGAALALECAQNGWRVGLCGRNNGSLAKVAGEVMEKGGRASTYVVDVVDADALEAAINVFEPDSLVCCAAVLGRNLLTDLESEEFAATLAINVNGTFNACRAAMLGWRKKRIKGDIVTVSSLGGLRGQQRFSGFAAYAASKHAIIGLTEALAIEGKPDKIRINAIAPGAFDTGMSRSLGLIPTTTASAIVPTIQYLLDRQQSGPLSGTTIEMPCNEQ